MSINIIIVDDERPAIKVLEFLLCNYPDLSIVGSYTNPMKALENLEKLNPDVIFLDINMPQLKGLDMGSNILDLCPQADIVFVTAYDQYALEAFDINALDYLLKPISMERLGKTIERIRKKHASVYENYSQTLHIKCFGKFQLFFHSREPMKFRSEKTRELFVYLLYNRDRVIGKDEILNQVWPNENADKAIRQLYNGIYYIRKALEEYGVDKQLIQIDCNYNIKLGNVDLDTDDFLELSKDLETGNQNLLEKMETIYAGEYLAGEDYYWLYSKREELAQTYQLCLLKLAEIYYGEGEYEKAEKKLLRAYEINPYNESITESLINLYLRTNKKSMGIKHFRTYVSLIKNELDIKPSERLIRLYHYIKLS